MQEAKYRAATSVIVVPQGKWKYGDVERSIWGSFLNGEPKWLETFGFKGTFKNNTPSRVGGYKDLSHAYYNPPRRHVKPATKIESFGRLPRVRLRRLPRWAP